MWRVVAGVLVVANICLISIVVLAGDVRIVRVVVVEAIALGRIAVAVVGQVWSVTSTNFLHWVVTERLVAIVITIAVLLNGFSGRKKSASEVTFH